MPGDYWCECAKCGGLLVSKGTWYTHNKERRRRTVASTLDLGATNSGARVDPPDVASSPSRSTDVKEAADEVDPPDDISRASRSDSVSVTLILSIPFGPVDRFLCRITRI
jgi:hypothetical protein